MPVLRQSSDAVGVCPPCEKALPWIPEEQAVLSEGDLTCAAPLWYEGNVREALLRLKFRGGSALAEPLASCWPNVRRSNSAGNLTR